MQEVLNVINYIVVHMPWNAVAASGVLSPLLLGIKKWFSVQSEKVMITLVALLACLTAAGHYLLTVPTHNPSIIAVQGFVLAFMTQPIYFFVVKPTVKWFDERVEEAAALNLAKSAAEPVPSVTAPTPVTEDFSQ